MLTRRDFGCAFKLKNMTIGLLLGIIIYLIYTYFIIKCIDTTPDACYGIWFFWTAYYIYRIYDAGLLDWLSYKLV